MTIRRMLPLLLFLPWLIACNKVLEEVPQLPFDVFPNPCIDRFAIAINPVFFAGDSVVVRVLDGKKAFIEARLSASDFISINMNDREPGVYHVEVTGKGETFIAPVLKTD